MTYLILFGVAFLVRALVGLAFPDPAYPDSYYYANLARQLADGHGFQIDYIWNFVEVGGRLPADPQLPIPSNAHWMPLAALVQVPFIWLLGPTSVAAGLPFWIIGAAAAPLTYLIGQEARVSHGAAVAAGLLVAVPGAVMPFLAQPDNFGLYMTLGALALWLCARGLQGDRRAFVAGGLVVGLATLARGDGVLLGVPFAVAAAIDLVRRRRARRIGLATALGCLALFVLVTGPWFLRQLDVFGSISPSAASGRILWITDYRELYSISGEPPTLASFLAQGIGPLFASRIGGLLAALAIFALLPLVLVLAPLAIAGAWQRRRDAWFAPFFIYVAALFGLSALLFAVHVPHGTFIHSAVALLPHTFLLVVVGISAAVDWIARRRSTWDARQATAFFTAGAVVVAMVGAILQTTTTLARWDEDRQVRRQLLAGLAVAPKEEALMSADAGAYRYFAGRAGIVTPDDPLPVIEAALRAYDIRWLVLERNHLVPALAPVLLGQVRPSWLSRPLVTVPTEMSTAGTDGGAAPGGPAAALYAICFSVADIRCTP